MNNLLSFQLCLNFGKLYIYCDASSTLKVAVAVVFFCLVEIKCFANISLPISSLSDLEFAQKNPYGKTRKSGSNECFHEIRCISC